MVYSTTQASQWRMADNPNGGHFLTKLKEALSAKCQLQAQLCLNVRTAKLILEKIK